MFKDPIHIREEQKGFKASFVTGLITILPLWLTLSVVWIAFKWISGVTSPFLIPVFRLIFGPTQLAVVSARVVSFFLTLFSIWFIGLLTRDIIGKRFIVWVETWFLKLPLLRDIYLSFQKLFQHLFTHKKAFRRVVLVPFPSKGVYSMGFVTKEEGVEEFEDKTGQRLTHVFVPTTPNPTTGFLIFVPREDVISLEMSVDHAFRLIISGGIIAPEKKVSAGMPPEDRIPENDPL